jgi:hemoglobin
MSSDDAKSELTPAGTSIFDRLGGVDIVRIAVDEFYSRVLADEVLLPFFENTSMARLKIHQLEFFKIAFGAVPAPEGLDVIDYMIEKHRHLFVNQGLNASHFDLVAGHLVASLQHLQVSPTLIDEVVATVLPLRTAFEKGADLHEDTAPSPEMTKSSETILDKLGGLTNLILAVHGMYDRILADEQLIPYFEKYMHMAALKQHQINFMKIAFTKIPDGFDVADYLYKKHKTMIENEGLNGTHFDLVAKHLVETLLDMGVDSSVVNEAVAVIAPLRGAFEPKEAVVPAEAEDAPAVLA